MWTREQWIENQNYWSDSRTINAMINDDCFFVKGSNSRICLEWVENKWNEIHEGDFEENQMKVEFNKWLTNLCGDQDLSVLSYNTKFQLCPTCGGKGTHVNPSIDCGGITIEEFRRDPEFFEDYMNGTYDIQCTECHGERVIQVLEYNTNNALYNWCSKRLEEHYEAQREYALEGAAERRWGC